MAVVDLNTRYATLMATLVVAGIVGILLVWMLFVAWRRARARKHRHRHNNGRTAGPDLWQASGDRLVSKINQITYEDKPPAPRGDTPPLEDSSDEMGGAPYDDSEFYEDKNEEEDEDEDDFDDDDDDEEDEDGDVQPRR